MSSWLVEEVTFSVDNEGEDIRGSRVMSESGVMMMINDTPLHVDGWRLTSQSRTDETNDEVS